MKRQLRFVLCLWIIVVSIVPIQAFGHTNLVEMNPKPDSQLELSPDQVQLLFNQKLEAATGDSLVVTNDTGKRLTVGPVEIGAEGKSIQVSLPTLPKGTYVVHYHVMSIDGHMVEDEYTFTVLAEAEEEEERAEQPTMPETPVAIPNDQVKPDVSIEVPTDYGDVPVEEDQTSREQWTSTFTEIEAADLLRMLYFVTLLLLVGMVIWYVILRRVRSEDDSRHYRNWTMQIQRIHLLVLIAVIAQFIHDSVGFDNWNNVRNILISTTAGTSWMIMLVLSLIGLGFVQRNKFIDVMWILAIVITKTQIGHPAAADYRIIASALTAIHIIAAALWAGGILYLILLWRTYRQVAERLIPTFSNGSLIAIASLVISGILSSMLYLTNLSYVFETRWGYLLLIKIAVVVIVIAVGILIRRRYIRKGLLRVRTWILLDFVMLAVIASIAALLTTAEPNPPNEPLHWHVMGDAVHMTAEITPKIPGDNRYVVSVWLPENSGDPKSVSMHIALEAGADKKHIELARVEGSNEYGFSGFNEYIYQADSDQLNQPGNWLIEITVIDQSDQSWGYKKQIRVF